MPAPADPASSFAPRYARWLARRAPWILGVAAVVLLGGAWLTATRLPVRADLSHLLPDDAPAVRDLHRIEQRVVDQDAVFVLVRTGDPAARATTAAELAAAIRRISPELVSRVEDDDAETRAYLRDHAHLFVPLADLERARDALAAAIERGKLAANPLYVSLDDDDDAAAAAAERATLDDLVAQRRDALARLDRSGLISDDGTLQLLIVRTAFAKTDAARGEQLMDALVSVRAEVMARPGHDGVEVGLCAGVATTVAEHHALVRGMLLSSLITVVLVALALWLYLRSLRLLAALGTTLTIGTVASFGVAAVTVGHLNAATAFLGAIIAGNGVNYGILLLGRYVEERRRRDAVAAMGVALAEGARPTLVASLGAAIAYGSLAATSFRGFADFAVIGGVGMVLCWIASFTVLPAAILRLAPDAAAAPRGSGLGAAMARVLGFRRPWRVCAVALLLAGGAGWVGWRFVAGDPFEYDARRLQSAGAEAREIARWRAISDAAFGRGLAGQTFIAVDAPAQVPQVIEALRRVDAGLPEDARRIGTVRSVLDVVPPGQPARLAALRELQAMLDDAPLDDLDPSLRAAIDELRPPAELAEVTVDDLPPGIAERLRERDGRVGLIVGVRPAAGLDDWDGRDIIRFAGAVRRVELPGGTTLTTSGPAVIYADILVTIRGDAPVVLAWAGGLLVVMVLGLVGLNRRAVAVLVSTALGTVGMVAVCALLGLRVTFLDFVALPITLGLGVDYAINVVHRHHRDGGGDPASALRTSGAAVFLCSLTTIIGYGSLLVADNQAIRGFGAASLIGELCCLATALIVAPAILGARLAPVDDVLASDSLAGHSLVGL